MKGHSKRRAASTATPPWKKRNPLRRHLRLTASQKAAARRAAQKAGRRYPNLVDNMRAARRAKSS